MGIFSFLSKSKKSKKRLQQDQFKNGEVEYFAKAEEENVKINVKRYDGNRIKPALTFPATRSSVSPAVNAGGRNIMPKIPEPWREFNSFGDNCVIHNHYYVKDPPSPSPRKVSSVKLPGVRPLDVTKTPKEKKTSTKPLNTRWNLVNDVCFPHPPSPTSLIPFPSKAAKVTQWLNSMMTHQETSANLLNTQRRIDKFCFNRPTPAHFPIKVPTFPPNLMKTKKEKETRSGPRRLEESPETRRRQREAMIVKFSDDKRKKNSSQEKMHSVKKEEDELKKMSIEKPEEWESLDNQMKLKYDSKQQCCFKWISRDEDVASCEKKNDLDDSPPPAYITVANTPYEPTAEQLMKMATPEEKEKMKERWKTIFGRQQR